MGVGGRVAFRKRIKDGSYLEKALDVSSLMNGDFRPLESGPRCPGGFLPELRAVGAGKIKD